MAAEKSLQVYDEVTQDFEKTFGRQYSAIETYRCEDAQLVFFMMGCFATKAKDAVDQLRESGVAIGLVRPRLLRPYPTKDLQNAFAGKQAVAVIDQNISMGKGGVLHSELTSILYGQQDAPNIVASFIAGLGGRDISAEEFYQIAEVLKQAVKKNETPEPQLLYTEQELRAMRKMQAIAHVERQELGSET